MKHFCTILTLLLIGVSFLLSTPTYANKDPLVAGILGIVIPGSGHLYTGEYAKGVILFPTTLGSAAAGVFLFSESVDVDTFSISSGKTYAGAGLLIVAASLWTYSTYDAAASAVRHNRLAFEIITEGQDEFLISKNRTSLAKCGAFTLVYRYQF